MIFQFQISQERQEFERLFPANIQDPFIPMINNLKYDYKTNVKQVANFTVPKKLGPNLRDFPCSNPESLIQKDWDGDQKSAILTSTSDPANSSSLEIIV